MTAPTDLPPPPRGHLRDQKWFRVLAACLAGMMIGYGLSGFAPKTPDWKRDAAQHHTLYRGWTVVPLSRETAALEADLTVASTAIEAGLSLAVLTSETTLKLKRVEVLGTGDAPMAQIMFAAPDGTPIGIYVLKRRGAAAWSSEELIVEAATRAGLASATWSTPDADFLLVGGDEPNRIEALAESLSRAIFQESQ